MYDFTDYALLALAMWREARGEGRTGMVAVGCSMRNRVQRDHSSYYDEATARLQYSSLTAAGDPELVLFGKKGDPTWLLAKSLAAAVIENAISDITGGATLYYAATIPFPAHWDRSKVVPTGTFGNQHFFREIV